MLEARNSAILGRGRSHAVKISNSLVGRRAPRALQQPDFLDLLPQPRRQRLLPAPAIVGWAARRSRLAHSGACSYRSAARGCGKPLPSQAYRSIPVDGLTQLRIDEKNRGSAALTTRIYQRLLSPASFGKTVSSWRYSAHHGAVSGMWTKPFSIIAVCMRIVLSPVGW